MERQSLRVTLIWVTVCVWSAALAVSVSRFHVAAKAAVTLSLAVKPSNVRLTVDRDRKLDGGSYIETPTKINLSPGRHELKITREGYTPHIISIEGEAGEALHMEDIALSRNTAVTVVAIDVQSDAPSAHVEIDDGFAHGDTPLLIPDVTAGDTHTLSFYPKWPNHEPRIKCKFAATESPFHMRIKTKNASPGKAKISGCSEPGAPAHHH